MGSARAKVARPGETAPTLVERERELAAVGSALDAAVGGAGGALLVAGQAGTGKTRLLAEAGALAEARGMRCLNARGAVLEGGFSFGIVRQLLEPELGRLDPDEADSVLAGAATPVRPLLRGAASSSSPPQDALFALVHGIYWVCARLSEGTPLLLAVDDFQWSDQPSARALEYLAPRLAELPIALVLAVRTGDRAGGLAVEEAVPSATRLTTAPLTEAGTARVLTDLLGSVGPRFSAAAHKATGGNAFLVREVAVAAASGALDPDEEGAERLSKLAPATVTEWTLARLSGLSEPAGTLARSLAVLEEAELAMAADHARLGREEAGRAADQLTAAGLLAPTLPLRFAHPLVRSSLYEQLPPAARDEAHRRAAELFANRSDGANRAASHLLQCERRGEEWAVETLRQAAGEAVANAAAGDAVRMLERALAERDDRDDPGLLLELGRARLALNDPAALEPLTAAAECSREPAPRAVALGLLAHARYLVGDTAASFELVGEALDAFAPGSGGAVEAELVLGLSLAGRVNPSCLAELNRRLAEPRLAPDGEPAPAEIVRRQFHALDAFMRGDRDRARAGGRWVAERLRDPVLAEALPSLAATGPAFVLAGIGEVEEADAIIADSLDRARRRGSGLETAEALHDRIWLRWRRGDAPGAIADCETVFALTEGAWETAKVPVRVAAAHMLLERGELAAAAEQLELPAELEERLPGTWGWTWLPLGRARVALAQGDPARGLEQARIAGERFGEIDAPSPEYASWRSPAARSAAGLGDREQARQLAEEELVLAREIGSERAIGIALATLGAVCDGDEGIEMLHEAELRLAATSAQLERVRAQVELGLALRRRRHPREARGPLRFALDGAHRIGARALAEVALTELQAAGGRPRKPRSTGVDALTPREHQTAELAAAGLGNREIAERLFITRKTVEAHLRGVFRKLGVSSRDQLRRFFPG